MPNWCHNVITITGSEQMMTKFYQTFAEGEKHVLSFQKTIPVESQAVETQTMAWGTKWDLRSDDEDIEILEETKNKYVVRCNTAWAPPMNWAKAASSKYHIDIKIAYVEGGIGYYGVAVYESTTGSFRHKEYTIDSNDRVCSDDDNGEEVIVGTLKKHMDKYCLISVGG